MQAGQAASFLGPVLLSIAQAEGLGPAGGGARDRPVLGEAGLLAVVCPIRSDSDGLELAEGARHTQDALGGRTSPKSAGRQASGTQHK